jgi:hypothetical protein
MLYHCGFNSVITADSTFIKYPPEAEFLAETRLLCTLLTSKLLYDELSRRTHAKNQNRYPTKCLTVLNKMLKKLCGCGRSGRAMKSVHQRIKIPLSCKIPFLPTKPALTFLGSP